MIALVPPPELTHRIEEIRREFASSYDCKAALKPPVHITLYPPYKADAAHEEEVKASLQVWCRAIEQFSVTLKGFDAFKKNGVIYIHVLPGTELKELHKGVSLRMNRVLQPELKSNQPFHAHFTIGFRDIPPERFQEALGNYLPRRFNASFIADHIEFWRHDGTRWQAVHSFLFRDKASSVGQAPLF